MNVYDAWQNFLDTGSVIDYLRYSALKNSRESHEEFPEYFDDDDFEMQEDDDENINGRTDNRGTGYW